MKRRIIIVLLSVVALVFLLLAGVGILLATLDLNDYKDRIARSLSEHTGLEVVFEGELETSIFPTLGLQTGRILVRNEALYGSEPFFEIGQSTFRLAIMPLLQKRLVIQEILLDKAAIRLVTTSTGQNNWERRPKATSTVEAVDIAPAEVHTIEERETFSLVAESITITNLLVSHDDLGAKTRKVLELPVFTIKNIGIDQQIPITLQGVWADSTSGFETALELQAEARISGIAGITPQSLRTAKIDLGVQKFNVEVAHLATNRPETLALQTSFTGLLDMGKMQIDLQNLQGTLQNEKLTGNLWLDLGDPIRIKSTLTLGTVNVDNFLNFFAENKAPASQGASSQPTPNAAPLQSGSAKVPGNPLAPLTSVNGNVNLQVGKITTGNINIQNLDTALEFEAGKLAASSTFDAFGSKVQVNATGNGTTKAMQGSFNAQVRDLRIENVLEAMTGQRKLSGLVQLSAETTFTGNSWSAIAPSLAGRTSFSLSNGEVTQIRLLTEPIPGVAPLADTFVVESIRSTGRIASGILSSNDITVVSPALLAAGAGSFNIPRNFVEARMDLRVGGKPPILPLVVSGTPDNLSYSIDMKAVGRNLLNQALESPEQLERTVRDLPNNAGRLLQNLERSLPRN